MRATLQTLLISMLLAWASPAVALTLFHDPNETHWIGPVGESANWFDVDNWTLGVPNSKRAAAVSGGGTALIETGAAQALSLSIGKFTPAHVTQSGGRLIVETRFNLLGGSYTLENGTVRTDEVHIGSLFPFFHVYPPHPIPLPKPVPGPIDLPTTNPKESVNLGDLANGHALASTSPAAISGQVYPPTTDPVVELPIAKIVPIDPRIYLPRPQVKTPVFTQNKGSVNVAGPITMRSGQYNMSGGTLRAESLHIDGLHSFFPPWLLKEPVPYVDPDSAPTDDSDELRAFFPWYFPSPAPRFNQTGGTVNLEEELNLGRGSYNLQQGLLVSEKLVVGGIPTFAQHDFIESPQFWHTGGANMVRGNLEIGAPLLEAITHTDQIQTNTASDLSTVFYPKPHPFPLYQKTSYRFEDGKLNVNGDLRVGSSTTGPARFTQTGGHSFIRGNTQVEGLASFMLLSGGKMTTGGLRVGTGTKSHRAFVVLLAEAELRVTDHVLLGKHSMFKAQAGSTLNMTGNSFAVESTNAANLAGLSELTLIFEGGQNVAAQLEVAGQDLGDTAAGYVDNFVIDTLQIGGSEPGHLTLVDLFDNQPDFAGAEALYVNNLIINPGSTFDMGGLNVYVANSSLSASAQAVNGRVLLVPEPSTALLLASLFVMARTRPRRESRTESRG